jgi:hypothetical protein
MTIFTAGATTAPVNQMYRSRNPSEDRYLVRSPGLLQGVRCYTDASTSTDLPSTPPRNAGIGLFIINTQVNPVQTIYIKAMMTATTSVLMVEAAAMALAAFVTDCLSMHRIIFLSDNQLLVPFLNGLDQANPPDWRIKHFTQTFTNFRSQRDTSILRIQRSQNHTNDVLARQALIDSQPPSNLACTCSNAAHVIQCLHCNL